jgi:hypothetical protein
MSEQIILNIVALVIGIMLFFSFVVAPLTFKVLTPDNAGVYIRAIFPYYYLVSLIICGTISSFYIYTKTFTLDFYLITSVTLLFAFSLFILMPMINKFKDEKNESKFKYSHLLSVIINFIQLISLGIILI